MRALIVVVASVIAAAVSIAATPDPAPPADRSAPAQQEKAARLDALFVALKAAPTTALGKVVEHEILVEWIHSGDDTIDKMMTQAVIAMDINAFAYAIDLLDEIVARRPDYVEGWNKRATVYFYVNEYDRSLADIEATLKLEPRHFGALAGLGMIMTNIGDKRRAIDAYERAVDVNPTLENIKSVIEKLKAEIGRDI